MTARMIKIATTIHTQRRSFLPGCGVEGIVEDSADGTGFGVESVFLLHPVVCWLVIKTSKHALQFVV